MDIKYHTVMDHKSYDYTATYVSHLHTIFNNQNEKKNSYQVQSFLIRLCHQNSSLSHLKSALFFLKTHKTDSAQHLNLSLRLSNKK